MARIGQLSLVLAVLLGVFVPAVGPAGATPLTYTYEVRGRDNVTSLAPFATSVAQTLHDDRGWTLGGTIAFRQVASGGHFTVWLSAASSVPSFGYPCDSTWSCRVGRNVVINEDRWRFASPSWNSAGGSLRDYRHMVVNHEVGHWLGFGHPTCAGAGQLAPVMQQQSISLQGCRSNPWPLPWERGQLAAGRGVAIVDGRDDVILRRGVGIYVDLGPDGRLNRSYNYGQVGDEVHVGDIDGARGVDVLLRRGRTFYVDLDANGTTNRSYAYGREDDQVHLGDFDGSGTADVLLRRGATMYLDLDANGTTNRSYSYGNGDEQVLIGDVDGNDADDVVLRRGDVWYVDLGADGTTNNFFRYGSSLYEAYVGDFDGDGRADLLLRRGEAWYVDWATNGTTNVFFRYGLASDLAYVGDFDSAGGDDLMLRRDGNTWYVDLQANGTTNRGFVFGDAAGVALIGDAR